MWSQHIMFLHDSVDMCRNRKWNQIGSGSSLLPGFLTWSLKMLKLSHESLEALLLTMWKKLVRKDREEWSWRSYRSGQVTNHLSAWFPVVQKIRLTPVFLWLSRSRKDCNILLINSSFCLCWIELGLSLSMRKDPCNTLTLHESKKRHTTSRSAVSASASEAGKWTPFLSRSRYTSFTSLASTPPGKPWDQVWRQQQKQNNS